ncbi:MAG: hypothetical protein EXR71_18795 [Myxococcales bacterium]|nr:hypothetical protein [Myxococcales bacterium]
MIEKAQSVTVAGEPDGFVPPRAWRLETFPDGHTRLVISVPWAELQTTHLALLDTLTAPLGVRYVQLTDRATGQLPTPQGRVAMGLSKGRVRAAMQARPTLLWSDGRHQLWLRGELGETVILDELGLLYASPDDPAFRDALAALAIPEATVPTLDKRDYVRVSFLAEADAEEASLWQDLNMLKWK